MRRVNPKSDSTAEPSTSRRRGRTRPTQGVAPRRRGQRVKRVFLIGLGVVLVLIAIAALLRFAPIVTVSSLAVDGAQRIDPQMVQERSGIHQGENMFALDTGAAASQVATLPWVKTASVTRQWPSTVMISVQEFQPEFYIKSADGYHMFDAQGRGFAIAPEPLGGVELTGIQLQNDEALASVGTVLAALPQPLRDQVKSVQAADRYSIELVLHDDRRVRWGSSEHAKAKAKAMEIVLQREGREWNISDPQQPSVK